MEIVCQISWAIRFPFGHRTRIPPSARIQTCTEKQRADSMPWEVPAGEVGYGGITPSVRRFYYT